MDTWKTNRRSLLAGATSLCMLSLNHRAYSQTSSVGGRDSADLTSLAFASPFLAALAGKSTEFEGCSWLNVERCSTGVSDEGRLTFEPQRLRAAASHDPIWYRGGWWSEDFLESAGISSETVEEAMTVLAKDHATSLYRSAWTTIVLQEIWSSAGFLRTELRGRPMWTPSEDLDFLRYSGAKSLVVLGEREFIVSTTEDAADRVLESIDAAEDNSQLNDFVQLLVPRTASNFLTLNGDWPLAGFLANQETLYGYSAAEALNMLGANFLNAGFLPPTRSLSVVFDEPLSREESEVIGHDQCGSHWETCRSFMAVEFDSVEIDHEEVEYVVDWRIRHAVSLTRPGLSILEILGGEVAIEWSGESLLVVPSANLPTESMHAMVHQRDISFLFSGAL